MGPESKQIEVLIKIAERLVPILRVCIANIRLYPVESEVIQTSINNVYKEISGILGGNEKLVLGEFDRNLIVNNSVIPMRGLDLKLRRMFENFIDLLNLSRIKNITFTSGLEYGELQLFLEVFSRKYWRRESDLDSLTDFLKKEKIIHILINEWGYFHTEDGSFTMEKAKGHAGEKEEKLKDFMRSLEEAMNVFELTDEKETHKRTRKVIVEKLVKLNPSSIADFLEEKFSGGIEKIKGKLISGIPVDYLKEVLIKIARLYKHLRSEIAPGSKREYELIKLRDAINMLLSSCKDKEAVIEIGNELIKLDFNELLPSWWAKPELSELELIVSKASLIVEKDSLSILDEDAREELPVIFLELDKLSKRELMKKLAGKINDNFNASVAGIRFRTVSLVKSLIPVMRGLANKDIFESIYNTVYEVIDRETDFFTYNELSGILISYVDGLIKSGDYGRSAEIIQMFRRHCHETGKGFSQRKEYAGRILKIFTSMDVMDVLVEDMKSLNREKQKDAVRIILSLGESTAAYLIKAIKQIRDYGTRKYITETLRIMGKGAVAELLDEISPDLDAEQLIRIIQMLPGLELDDVVCERMRRLIKHHNKEVKLEIIRTLDRLNSDRVGGILMTALKDEDRYIQREAINIIGNKKYFPAIDELVNLIRPVSIFKRDVIPDMIQEAVCRCLAKLESKRAVPYLVDIIGKPKLFEFKRVKNKSVRIAAIHASKNFKVDRITETLSDIKDSDRDSTIQMAVEDTLQKLT